MEHYPFKNPATNIFPRLRPASAIAVALVASVVSTWGLVSPVQAQDVDRFRGGCSLTLAAGVNMESCNFVVPQGRRLIITSATAYGSVPSTQSVLARLNTTVNGAWAPHYFQVGFLNLTGSWTVWNGAVPGTFFAEPGDIRFWVSRAGTSNSVTFNVTVSGYFE